MVDDARLVERPDGRRFLVVPGSAAFAERLDRVLAGCAGDLFIEVDGSARERLAALAARGFHPHRRERLLSIPVQPIDAPFPPGYTAISAADADLNLLRHLDDALRQDVPGAHGWRNDPTTFERHVTGDPEFDPQTYLIALAPGGDYAGLARVWIGPTLTRLGLIGVLPSHRRRGLARALLAAAFTVLHARGVATATCEVDETNTASNTLMRGLGATEIGDILEMIRRG